LLSPTSNSLGRPVQYAVDGTSQTLSTIAELYVATGRSNLETLDGSCADKFMKHAQSMDLVVDPCASGTCGSVMAGQIDARDFACADTMGKLMFDDLSAALIGMHPASVWLTRLEGNLSRVALELDLELQAEQGQAPVDNWLQAGKTENSPCQGASAAPLFFDPSVSPREKRKRTEFAGVVVALLGLGLAIGRRSRRAFLLSYSR
jgi:hypothetical protein